MTERHETTQDDTPLVTVSTELKPCVFKDLESSAFRESRSVEEQVRHAVHHYLYGVQGFFDRLLATQKDTKRHDDGEPV